MPSNTPAPGQGFPATKWSLVLTAPRPEALEELCFIYWKPIYGYIRRSGRSPEDAEDLTQSFFAEILHHDGFGRAKKEHGKMRSFLLGALKRHLELAKRSQLRQKRGAGAPHLPIANFETDFEDAEHQYAAQPVNDLTPDKVFERCWVLDLIHLAHQRLQHDYEAAGKGREYSLLKNLVMSPGEVDSSSIARELGVKEASVRVLVHRMRKNFRAAFKEEIANTLDSREEVNEEYHRLLQVFS